jgi:hypothetical protein
MNAIWIMILFAVSSATTVFLFLLSLRKLGSTIKNYASLFTGIDHLLLFLFINDIYVRFICLGVGIFITVFSFVKIIRRMD